MSLCILTKCKVIEFIEELGGSDGELVVNMRTIDTQSQSQSQ